MDLSKKLVFMILVLVINGDFEDIMDILYIAGREKDQFLLLVNDSTYKVNTFCQTGVKVFGSVCVVTLLFTTCKEVLLSI